MLCIRSNENKVITYCTTKAGFPSYARCLISLARFIAKNLSFTQFVTRTILLVKATPQSLVGFALSIPLSVSSDPL